MHKIHLSYSGFGAQKVRRKISRSNGVINGCHHFPYSISFEMQYFASTFQRPLPDSWGCKKALPQNRMPRPEILAC